LRESLLAAGGRESGRVGSLVDDFRERVVDNYSRQQQWTCQGRSGVTDVSLSAVRAFIGRLHFL